MLPDQWKKVLEKELSSSYFKSLQEKLDDEYQAHTIYPAREVLFTAFELCDYEEVKVVILGQDPYIRSRQAHGLAFSVQPHTPLPPSLKNIYREINSDLGLVMSQNGCLESWARQGVFLLNAVLSVREGQSKSHFHLGWETFTDAVIEKLNKRPKPIVFLLWGNDALAKRHLITSPTHLILTAPHPSPLSAFRGFFGCKHFSKVNYFLEKNEMTPIDWQN